MNNCTNEALVEELFGSTTEFARLVEEHGDNFTYGNVVVTYDEVTDIHTFS